MKTFCYSIILAIASLVMSGCEDNQPNLVKVSLGTASYHPSFLWTDSGSEYIEKTITLDFNDDAKNNQSKAVLQFCDEKWNLISLKDYYVEIDGKELSDAEYEVNASQKELPIKIGCTPDADAGNKQVYIRIKQGHSFDYINDMEVENAAPLELMRMDFHYEKNMNPLALILMWIGIVFISSLLIWLVMLRPIVYRRFGSIRKGVYIPNQAPVNINFKGARLVVLDNVMHKQPLFDRIFKGKILYKQHPAIKAKITFKTRSKGRILVVTNGAVYRVNPNPMPKIGTATMTDITQNINIQIR